ncbi:glucosamine-6-phosphate isomerase [Desulfitobacterium dehalogenans ATCC 51507]|uniref:Glucosamine-6-phosphate deaminase n=1 Tax=Desulfitobacterium dehalogenans (strain ATCC 51507 / DSM 9161 / JW/IU-DC1) TaxID=756499 RepID=I4A7C3_DESDJ|nr:glucosamine-6-phosphate deaminase [Desulfitobacterium dehalogenans]AFL99857.1 glucosamine-6-phosphate isomerase [Desulfitobacterium dehalogenans ATCC 51507]
MDIIIRENYKLMSKYAAEIIAGYVRSKPDCVLGLATGSTPIGTYQELVRMHREEGLDFSQVKTFNLDEYLGAGIDLEKPYPMDQSYARFMHEELLKNINIKKENIHIPDGRTKDPKKFCIWYEEEIKKAGGIDLQLLGLGGDGHWGFNEPGSSLGSRTRVVVLTQQTLDDNYEAFYKKANIERSEMPHFAITMGIGTILEARNILMIVNGARKADMVAKCLEGPITSQITASAIQLHGGEISVVLDEGAASKLLHTDHYRHVESIKRQYGL